MCLDIFNEIKDFIVKQISQFAFILLVNKFKNI